MKCPFCDSEMIIAGNYSLQDVGVLQEETSSDDETMAYHYACENCGSSVLAYECIKEDKHRYPYWKE